jgi:hypothetical protein
MSNPDETGHTHPILLALKEPEQIIKFTLNKPSESQWVLISQGEITEGGASFRIFTPESEDARLAFELAGKRLTNWWPAIEQVLTKSKISDLHYTLTDDPYTVYSSLSVPVPSE